MILVDDNGITYTPSPECVEWFEPERLSVRLYYVKPLRVLAKEGGLSARIDSDTYKLLKPDTDALQREKLKSLLTDKITISDGAEPFAFRIGDDVLYTVYIVGQHDKEEAVLNDLELRLGDATEPETVRIGATFYDESEELRVAGENRGIRLPADVCKGFWDCGFDEYYPDRAAQRDKLKELLLEYMGIRGFCGSYDSAVKALKWWGWGDKAELKQLVELNRAVPGLLTAADFDITSRTSFENFRRTTFLTLKTRLHEFAGLLEAAEPGPTEGTYRDDPAPLYDSPAENGPRWIRRGFEYSAFEIGLKLAAMASMYEEYFLPVQLNVVSSPVVEHVSAAPLKLVAGTCAHTVESVNLVSNPGLSVRLKNASIVGGGAAELIFDKPEGSCEVFLIGRGVERVSTGCDDYAAKIEGIEAGVKTLAVLAEGCWFCFDVNVAAAAESIEIGTLEYSYGDAGLVEPEMLLSYGDEIAKVSSYDIPVPACRKNIVLQKEIDAPATLAVDAVLASGFLVDVDGRVMAQGDKSLFPGVTIAGFDDLQPENPGAEPISAGESLRCGLRIQGEGYEDHSFPAGAREVQGLGFNINSRIYRRGERYGLLVKRGETLLVRGIIRYEDAWPWAGASEHTVKSAGSITFSEDAFVYQINALPDAAVFCFGEDVSDLFDVRILKNNEYELAQPLRQLVEDLSAPGTAEAYYSKYRRFSYPDEELQNLVRRSAQLVVGTAAGEGGIWVRKEAGTLYYASGDEFTAVAGEIAEKAYEALAGLKHSEHPYIIRAISKYPICELGNDAARLGIDASTDWFKRPHGFSVEVNGETYAQASGLVRSGIWAFWRYAFKPAPLRGEWISHRFCVDDIVAAKGPGLSFEGISLCNQGVYTASQNGLAITGGVPGCYKVGDETVTITKERRFTAQA